MNEIKKGVWILTGMFTFMCIFPTTFIVVMNGLSLAQKVIRQMFPTIRFF